jgi:hypothetical protein
MKLRDAHYDLLDTLIQDMEPFDAIVHMLEVLKAPLSPQEALDLLLELQSFGLVSSSVLVDLKSWRSPRLADFERALAEVEGRVEQPSQSDLWFRLTEAGQAEWRAKNGEIAPRAMWRIAEYGDVVEVNAVSSEVAAAAVADWQERNPEIAIQPLSTKTPAPFTLPDGTKVQPGVLVTFRRRPLRSGPLS